MYNQQQSLQQLVQTTRNQKQDKKSYLIAQIADIKQELKERDQDTIKNALLKLYFLYFEGFDLQWADYNILSTMGAENYSLKRIAYSQASMLFYPQSTCLMMSTNLFKKEIMKSQYLEASSALSCLCNIITEDMGGDMFLNEAIKLLNHTQPEIRKKANALIAKILQQQPALIDSHIENIISKLYKNEINTAVLSSTLSIINVVVNNSPQSYPLFIKPLFELFQSQKTNWFLIKLVKIFNKLIHHEKRLVQKLAQEIEQVLDKTKSKSLEHEIINVILSHYKEDNNLYNIALEKLKFFLMSKDKNLRQVGLNNLKIVLKNDQKSMQIYKQDLLQIFKENDRLAKLSIMNIFNQFVAKGDLEDICLFFLNNSTQNILEDVIEFVIDVVQRDNFAYVEDFEWILVWVIPLLAKNTSKVDNAYKIQKLLFNLISMVEELKEQVNETALQIINSLIEKQDNLSQNNGTNRNNDNNYQSKMPIYESKSDAANQNISPEEIFYQTMVFLLGEHSNLFKSMDEFLAVFELFKNQNILELFQSSQQQIIVSIFKLLVNFSEHYVNGDLQEEPEEKLNSYKSGVMIYISILRNIYKRDLQLINSDIFNTKILQQLEIRDILSAQLVKQEQINTFCTEKNIQSIQNLKNLFNEEFEPINQNSQSLIKPPQGFDITQEIAVNAEEIDLIKNLMQNMDFKKKQVQQQEDSKFGIFSDQKQDIQNKQQKQKQSQDLQDQQLDKKQQDENNKWDNESIQSESQMIQKSNKPKKEYKIKQQADLPDQ